MELFNEIERNKPLLVELFKSGLITDKLFTLIDTKQYYDAKLINNTRMDAMHLTAEFFGLSYQAIYYRLSEYKKIFKE